MTAPKDFGIAVRLQARRMLVHDPPDHGSTQTEGVDLSREETRDGLPGQMRLGDVYEDVAVDKRLAGEVHGRTE